ncbi:MAG: glycosyltransferase [bacterium]
MKILMISDVYFPRINGVSTSIMTYRRALRERGHRVTLIAPEYNERVEDESDIIRIPSRSLIVDKEDRMMKATKIYGLKGELVRENFDIIHIQTPFVAHYVGVSLARRLNVPRVESYHTFFEEYLQHYVPFVPKPVLRFIARRFSASQCNGVDALIVPSGPMLEVLRGYGVNTPAEIIPTGINLKGFTGGDGEAFRRRYGIPMDRPVLITVGRVAFEKNIDFLIRVADAVRRAIPDVFLIIAGGGPAVASLKRLVGQLDLDDHVLFAGYLAYDKELLDCYRAADVFIFASRTETQGLVLLEAMAMGVPVVSTAVMGTKDILYGARGAVVAQEDLDDFAGKVVSVLNDPKLRRTLSGEALRDVGKWSEERLVTAMIALYERVVASRHAPRT